MFKEYSVALGKYLDALNMLIKILWIKVPLKYICGLILGKLSSRFASFKNAWKKTVQDALAKFKHQCIVQFLVGECYLPILYSSHVVFICSQYTKYNKPIQVVTEEPIKPVHFYFFIFFTSFFTFKNLSF